MTTKSFNLKLPSPECRRWVMRRKFAVVMAIKFGDITEEEAKKRYRLSTEELKSWFTLSERFGSKGLRATRIQDYKDEMADQDRQNGIAA